MLFIAQEGADLESIKRWSLHQTRTSGFRNLRQRLGSQDDAMLLGRGLGRVNVCADAGSTGWLANCAARGWRTMGACHGQTSRAGVRGLTTYCPIRPRTAPPARVGVGCSLTRQLGACALRNDDAPSVALGQVGVWPWPRENISLSRPRNSDEAIGLPRSTGVILVHAHRVDSYDVRMHAAVPLSPVLPCHRTGPPRNSASIIMYVWQIGSVAKAFTISR